LSDVISFSAIAAPTTSSFPIVARGSTSAAFIESSTRCRGETGLRAPGARNGPRLHDFRHRFAVQVLTRWYESGADPARRLPALSTYLGHVSVAGTYWYLSNSPELMMQAMARLEQRWGETP
jgi:integrase